MRIHQLAKELGMTSKKLLILAQSKGMDFYGRNDHFKVLTQEQVNILRDGDADGQMTLSMEQGVLNSTPKSSPVEEDKGEQNAPKETVLGEGKEAGVGTTLKKTNVPGDHARNGIAAEKFGSYRYGQAISTIGREQTNRFLTELQNEKPAWKAANAEGFVEGALRSINGPDLISAVNPRLQYIISPVERDVVEKDVDTDTEIPDTWLRYVLTREFGMCVTEVGGWIGYMSNALYHQIFGSDKHDGSHTRAVATVPSLQMLRTTGHEKAIVCNLSDPFSVPREVVTIPQVFYAPYFVRMSKYFSNEGLELKLVKNELGQVLYYESLEANMSHMSIDEIVSVMGTLTKARKDNEGLDKYEPLEIDGECWCSEDIMEKYGIKAGGIQFRAIDKMSDEQASLTNLINAGWRTKVTKKIKEIKESHLQDEKGIDLSLAECDAVYQEYDKKVMDAVDNYIDTGRLSELGVYKGLVLARAGLKEGTILLDINACKGRNKKTIKNHAKARDGHILDLAWGILAGVEDESYVASSWQTLFLTGFGNIEKYTKNLTAEVFDALRELLHDGILRPWLAQLLRSGVFVDIDEETGRMLEERASDDLLTTMVNNFDALQANEEHNIAMHPQLINKIVQTITRYNVKNRFGFLPYGQTQKHFGEVQPRALSHYIWSAIDCPWYGTIRINDSYQCYALMAYHHDPRYWGKTGLMWRYPILKNTTIMPIVWQEPPAHYKLANGSYPKCIGMSEMAIKEMLFGDTDGDKVCYYRLFIDGDDQAKINFSAKDNTFKMVINRKADLKEDDFDLLRTFGDILSMKRPKQQDPVIYLDRIKELRKQPVNTSWLNPVEPWRKGESSRRIIGPVAIMSQAVTRLEGELRTLETVTQSNKLISAFENDQLFDLRYESGLGKESQIEVRNALSRARSIVDDMFAWFALQGEAAVCGAKYLTSKHHAIALAETFRQHKGICNWCQTCKNKECGSCAKTSFDRLVQLAEQQPEIHEDMDYDSIIEYDQEDLDRIYAGYVVLLDSVVQELEYVRKCVAPYLVKEFKNGKRERAIHNHKLNYQPRWSLRMSEKVSIGELLKLRGNDVNEFLSEHCSEPNFISDVTSRAVNSVIGDIQEMQRWVASRKEEARGKNIKSSKVSGNLMQRRDWAKYVATEGLRPQDILTDPEEKAHVDRILETHEFFWRNHILIPKFHKADRGSGIDSLRKDGDTMGLHLFESMMSRAQTYAELRATINVLRYVLCTDIEFKPFAHIEAPDTDISVPMSFYELDKEDLIRMMPNHPEKDRKMTWKEFFATLTRLPRMSREAHEIIEILTEKEQDMWRGCYMEFLNSLDIECRTLPKRAIEYAWRFGHAKPQETKTGKLGPYFFYGPKLAIQWLFIRLDEFLPYVSAKKTMRTKGEFGPVVFVGNKPSIGDKGSLQMVSGTNNRSGSPRTFFQVSFGEDEGFLMKAPYNKAAPALAQVAPWSTSTRTWAKPKEFVVFRVKMQTEEKDGQIVPTMFINRLTGEQRHCWLLNIKLVD